MEATLRMGELTALGTVASGSRLLAMSTVASGSRGIDTAVAMRVCAENERLLWSAVKLAKQSKQVARVQPLRGAATDAPKANTRRENNSQQFNASSIVW